MNEKSQVIHTSHQNLHERVLPSLLGEVFHVTSGQAFRKIQETGFINSNKGNTYPLVFPQSSSNFGTRNGLVSLIDLRQKSYDEAEKYAGEGYYFLRPKNDWVEVVFLLINPNFYKDLKLQSRFNPRLEGKNYIAMEEIYKGTYVPEIECWYPEKITLDKLSKVLIVNII
ncbi:hypothetical protein IIA95_03850 [Patescibacteria group bacterium]|nr:hypothetical protein [Patescibacteria group bacterium]